MNRRMAELLTQFKIQADLGHAMHPGVLAPTDFVTVDDSVLLRSEHEKSTHIKARDFPDRTGFECFINHLHVPFNGTRESLLGSLGYATALRQALSSFQGREFLVITSIADGECTVRFHQVRQNENWVSEDLERYGSEAILLLRSRAPGG